LNQEQCEFYYRSILKLLGREFLKQMIHHNDEKYFTGLILVSIENQLLEKLNLAQKPHSIDL
jgi:hypothetical protein